MEKTNYKKALEKEVELYIEELKKGNKIGNNEQPRILYMAILARNIIECESGDDDAKCNGQRVAYSYFHKKFIQCILNNTCKERRRGDDFLWLLNKVIHSTEILFLENNIIRVISPLSKKEFEKDTTLKKGDEFIIEFSLGDILTNFQKTSNVINIKCSEKVNSFFNNLKNNLDINFEKVKNKTLEKRKKVLESSIHDICECFENSGIKENIILYQDDTLLEQKEVKLSDFFSDIFLFNHLSNEKGLMKFFNKANDTEKDKVDKYGSYFYIRIDELKEVLFKSLKK